MSKLNHRSFADPQGKLTSELGLMSEEGVAYRATMIVDPDNIPEFIEVDMEEIKSKEKVRLSALEKNSSYSFPKSLKNQDPVIVSVLTARGGAMLLEDEVEEDADAVEGEEATTQEGDNEKAPEENKPDNSEEKSE